MSMTTVPGLSSLRTPFSPVSTCSTSGVSGTIVMMMVAARATSAGEPAAVAPAATTSSTGFRLREVTTRRCPAFMRLSAMGLPHDSKSNESNHFRRHSRLLVRSVRLQADAIGRP